MMYLLTQPDGARPTIVDDRNFYRPAGVKKWVKNGVPEQGHQAAARHHLVDAHPDRGRPAAAEPDAHRRRDGAGRLDPRLARAAGPARRPEVPQAVRPDARLRLGTPRWKLADILRWQVPLPWYANLRATTVGLRHKGEYLIKAMCPPNYPTMADAVDAVVAEKFGPRGIYADEALFERIYRGEFGDRSTSARPATTRRT